jgi:molybdopterin-biosynthesis enzyme MoeA-like protein
VGDEILSGKRADKHLPKLIELLAERGLRLDWAEYVGDSPTRLTAVLQRAFQTSAVVFSCGGIGATPDDHTRQCAAKALDVDLALHPQAKALILERMQDIAREQGVAYEPEREDNVHRLNMGVFPQGSHIIPNPYNKIAGFSRATLAGGVVHFVPGFPVMAWPMMAWALDTYHSPWFERDAWVEQSIIVYGGLEATLTPLMEQLERDHPSIRIFSLPSVDHPQYGRHIELGVKGHPDQVTLAYADLIAGLKLAKVELGAELVR